MWSSSILYLGTKQFPSHSLVVISSHFLQPLVITFKVHKSHFIYKYTILFCQYIFCFCFVLFLGVGSGGVTNFLIETYVKIIKDSNIENNKNHSSLCLCVYLFESRILKIYLFGKETFWKWFLKMKKNGGLHVIRMAVWDKYQSSIQWKSASQMGLLHLSLL